MEIDRIRALMKQQLYDPQPPNRAERLAVGIALNFEDKLRQWRETSQHPRQAISPRWALLPAVALSTLLLVYSTFGITPPSQPDQIISPTPTLEQLKPKPTSILAKDRSQYGSVLLEGGHHIAYHDGGMIISFVPAFKLWFYNGLMDKLVYDRSIGINLPPDTNILTFLLPTFSVTDQDRLEEDRFARDQINSRGLLQEFRQSKGKIFVNIIPIGNTLKALFSLDRTNPDFSSRLKSGGYNRQMSLAISADTAMGIKRGLGKPGLTKDIRDAIYYLMPIEVAESDPYAVIRLLSAASAPK